MPEDASAEPDAPHGDWRPTATLETLHARADLYGRVRRFFAGRGVLEVETPLLQAATVTDLHLHSLGCELGGPRGVGTFHLQTSPEFAMKRLLAAGSGPIYQLCKAFRADELGHRHNPEFTMLEWYRPGFDHHRLMDEMDALLDHVLGCGSARRATYGELFGSRVGIDPHRADPDALARSAREHGIELVADGPADRDGWLHLLWSHAVEPTLGQGRPTFVHDFPATQAALARIRPGTAGEPSVAERFEVYIDGVELANGFHELDDAHEQRRRFEADLAARRRAGLPEPPIDERLLAALDHGIGDCAGVALGMDRLLMLRLGIDDIRQVLAFPIDRA